MLEEQLRARVAIFMHGADSVSTLAACGPSDPEMVREYEDHLWREDRGMQKLRSSPVGEIVLDSNLIDHRERTKSPFYNDYLASLDAHRGIYASVLREGGSMFVVSAQRSAKVGDYESKDTNLLRWLSPHLNRSFRTWHRLRGLEGERQAALEAMEHVRIGLALVDKDGRLCFANGTAREHIADGVLTLSNGRITSRSSETAEALHAAIQEAVRPERAVAHRLALPSKDGSPSSVLVSPVRSGAMADVHSGSLAMLLVGGQDTAPVEVSALSDAYRLTPAEARLLAALVAGERLGAYAHRTGISVATAKSHLGALFDKVGERRQADLIRRVIAHPFFRGPGRQPPLGPPRLVA
jgi:DNA-binding CsgD family transcriptional regulator